MKTLWIWMACALGLYGGAAGAYHAYLDGNPRRVAIVIDSAFEMRGRMPAAHTAVKKLVASMRYTDVALFTDKSMIAGYSRSPQVPQVKAYGPRHLERLSAEPLASQLAEADHVILFSNADGAARASVPGAWEHRVP